MKVILDPDELLDQGHITPDEYMKLNEHGVSYPNSWLYNVATWLSIVIVLSMIVGFAEPYSGIAAIVVGLPVLAGGLAGARRADPSLRLLAGLSTILGAGFLLGGIAAVSLDWKLSPTLFLCCNIALIGLAWLARSSLLAFVATLTAIAASAALFGDYFGDDTPYGIAALIALLNLCMGLAACGASEIAPDEYKRAPKMTARACFIAMNAALAVGAVARVDSSDTALWGLNLLFGLVWFLGLVIAGMWAWRSMQRWEINVVAANFVLMFYLCWFLAFGGTEGAGFIASLLLIGVIFGFKALNRHMQRYE